MTNLVGNGITCKAIGGTNAINEINQNRRVYPNPLNGFIQIKEASQGEIFTLINMQGEKIYEGESISKQNFSYLSNGVYFLKSNVESTNIIKLFKQ